MLIAVGLSIFAVIEVTAFQTLDPAVKKGLTVIPHQSFTLNEDEQLHLKYKSQHSTYGYRLFEYDSKEQYIPEKSKLTSDYKQLTDEQISEKGFKLIPAQPIINLLSEINTNQGTFFTSMGARDEDGLTYLLSQDYVLSQMSISNRSENASTIVGLELLNQTYNLMSYFDFGIESSPFMVYNTKDDLIYVLSSIGAISFLSGSEPKPTKQTEFYKCTSIQYARYVESLNLVVVACGSQGVYIYEVKAGQLALAKAMPGSVGFDKFDGFPEEVMIVDVNVDDTEKILVALDSKSGLYFFDIHTPREPLRRTFFIEQKNGWAFDMYQRTIVVAYRSIDEQFSIVAELFVTYEKNEYYINNLYFNIENVNDIHMTSQYAIIIGNDLNMVFQHSVFNGFTNISQLPITTFQQAQLIQVYILTLNQTQYLIGMGMNSIRVFEYVEAPFQITFTYGPQALNMGLLMQSSATEGDTKMEQYLRNDINHLFYVKVLKVAIDSSNKNLAIGLGVGLTVGLLGIIGVALFCWCRARGRLNKKKEKYSSYNDIEVIEVAQE